MTESVQYLELDDLLVAAQAFLGKRPEVRDYGLLESALARPRATVFGEDAYPAIHEKAAALLDSLVNNHALVDGNKRLGWVAVRLFYGFNGYTVSASEDEKVQLVLDVATGELNEVAKIAQRLQQPFAVVPALFLVQRPGGRSSGWRRTADCG